MSTLLTNLEGKIKATLHKQARTRENGSRYREYNCLDKWPRYVYLNLNNKILRMHNIRIRHGQYGG